MDTNLHKTSYLFKVMVVNMRSVGYEKTGGERALTRIGAAWFCCPQGKKSNEVRRHV
jgi:hypothetical protein